jgi:hypothetical protein
VVKRHLSRFGIAVAVVAVGVSLTLPGAGRADNGVLPIDFCAIAPADATATLAYGQSTDALSGDASYAQHPCPRFVVDVNIPAKAYLWIFGIA